MFRAPSKYKSAVQAATGTTLPESDASQVIHSAPSRYKLPQGCRALDSNHMVIKVYEHVRRSSKFGTS